MSQTILFVSLLLGFAAPAFAQQTELQVPGTISDKQIADAIANLELARTMTEPSARHDLIVAAKEDLVAQPATEVFAAEVESEGDKQFIEEYSGMPHLHGTCFRGAPTETARLINRALEVGQWEGDEERILSAKADGAKVILKIEDQPNESIFDFELESCE